MTDSPDTFPDSHPPSTGPHRFSMREWISCAPYERLLHIQIVRADQGEAVLTMPFLLEFAQGAGLMHGGALVSLADTAVVMAIKSLVAPHTHFASTSMESQFHHPVKQGRVTARARVIEHKAALLKGQAVIFDEDRRPVMTFSATFKVAKDTTIKGVEFKDQEP